jgi:PAP2 superfamily
MTLTPSAADHAAPDEPASSTRAAQTGLGTKRRIIAMTIWAAAFVGLLFVLGLPTDPVYAFIWLWALTIAWHSERPWRSHLLFLRDWASVVILLVLYNISRGLADKGIAPHVTEMIHADKWMFGWFTGGVVPTVWLQEHLYHVHVQWYDVLASFVYFSHFVTALLVAVVLWLRDRERWASFIRRWVTVNILGLATYFLYPAAPPWWAADRGLIQPIHDGLATRGWSAIGLHGAGNLLNAAKVDAANPVAAMPSLHSAYALIVVAFFLPTVRKRWWPLLLAYPLAMTFTLVYSGEHYMTDVLVGWLYVVVTMVGVSAAEKGWAARQRRRDVLSPAAVPVSPVPTGLAADPAMAVSRTPGASEVEPERAPVASAARNRPDGRNGPDGDEAWSADDDAAAEIAASASYEPSVVSDRIAD